VLPADLVSADGYCSHVRLEVHELSRRRAYGQLRRRLDKVCHRDKLQRRTGFVLARGERRWEASFDASQ